MSEQISEVTIEVERKFLCKINNLLTDAKENAYLLLTEHDNSLGRSTKKNSRIAEMYEQEINELDSAIFKVRQMVK